VEEEGRRERNKFFLCAIATCVFFPKQLLPLREAVQSAWVDMRCEYSLCQKFHLTAAETSTTIPCNWWDVLIVAGGR